jgi:hypothetical protein
MLLERVKPTASTRGTVITGALTHAHNHYTISTYLPMVNKEIYVLRDARDWKGWGRAQFSPSDSSTLARSSSAARKLYNYYMMGSGSGIVPGTDYYDFVNPTYAWVFLASLQFKPELMWRQREHRNAYNYRSTPAPASRQLWAYVTNQKHKFHYLFELSRIPPPGAQSDWVYLIDMGLKSSDGKTAHQVLLDVIKDFPKYDLKFDEGIDKAIEEITTKLGKVVSFKERSGCWKGKYRGLLLCYLAACISLNSCATQPTTRLQNHIVGCTRLSNKVTFLRPTVEELIYLGLTRVSGAFGDGLVVVR